GTGSGNINDAFASMTPGQSVTYTVTMPIPADFDQNTNVITSVSVNSDTPDPNPACADCTDLNTPLPLADLIVTNSDGQNTFINNADVTYTLTITNNGPSNANNISVSEALPPGITIMNWTGSNG